jgi:protein O-GlcNAc transferase
VSEISIQSLLAKGISHHQSGRLDQASEIYRLILETHPQNPDALHLTGVIARQKNDLPRSIDLISQAVRLNPSVPAFHNNLGISYMDAERLADAIAAFGEALRLNPQHAQAQYNLASAQQRHGDLRVAVQSYQRAIRLAPSSAECWNNLGNCYFALGDANAALASFGRAQAIDKRSIEPQNNAAAVFLAIGQAEQAERIYRQILSLNPSFAEAHYNLGLALLELERPNEAIESFLAALRYQPDYALALHSLGNALCELGEYETAARQYESAIRQKPDFAAPRLALAMTSAPLLAESTEDSARIPERFTIAMEALEDWCRASPGALATAIGSTQPFALAYRPDDVTSQLAQYGTLVCDQVSEARTTNLPGGPAIVGRARARFGIVSGHVRRHPVWQIILQGIMTHIDRSKFDVRLYDTTKRHDEASAWAASQVDHHRAQPLTSERWVEHIEADAPDILFFPEVGMDPATGFIAAHRLAALQVSSWGHPVTTGLPSIDLFLTGDLMEPADAATHYSETLIRLPGTGVFTKLDAPIAQRWRGPPRHDGRVRFALCQQAMKFDPADDSLIARVVAEAGDAELWIVHSAKHQWTGDILHKRLSRALSEAGLDPATHLRITPWMKEAEFLGFLAEMDVVLDCPAFSGYTTAWQAMHCGTPLVTLEGKFLRQRLAAGLLRQTGQLEGLARDEADYVARAVSMAERSINNTSREALRNQMRGAAVLADGNRAAVTSLEQHLLV